MNKYDFGYDINKDDANLWAFHTIRPGSTVLEIGSSNGRLTKHLNKERGCTVDIVEINQEAGKEAAKFSRNSYLGEINGNIELPEVISLFSESEYDYIVFLDVLEHLFNPGLVLRRMKRLLKDCGVFVISIPNIAHNSVIINLINNRFQYTDVGLLDNTHLHFYTVDTIRQVIKDAGCYIQKISATQKRVGDNEIENSYEDVPRDVAAFLRTRNQADIYQILLLAGKKEIKPEPCLFQKNLEYTLYKAQIYTGETEKECLDFFVDPKMIELRCHINKEDCYQPLRIDPIDRNCILRINKAIGVDGDREYPLPIVSTNGESLYNGEYVFWDDDPQIYFQCPQGTEYVTFSFSCQVFDSVVLQHFKELGKEVLLAHEREKDGKRQAELKDQYIRQYLNSIEIRDDAIEKLKKEILEQNEKINLTYQENLTIKQQNQVIVEQNKHLNHDISVIQQENYTIKGQNEDIQKMNIGYQKELELLRGKLDHVEYRASELEKDLCLKNETIRICTAKYSKDLVELRNSLKRSENKMSNIEKELSAKKEEVFELTCSIDSIQAENQRISKLLNNNIQQLEEADHVIKGITSENEELKKLFAEAKNELSKIHGHLIYKIISKVKKGN